MNDQQPILTLDHLTVSRGDQIILEDCNLSLNRGDVGVILGKSGCGKTTLLRAISGLNDIEGGSIILNNTLLQSDSVFVPPHQRDIGIVFQEPTLFEHMSVFDNIVFGLHHLPKAEQSQIATELLETIELTGFENRYPHELSGGQQQRVAIARSIAPRPKLLLLDEPFSNLDPSLKEHLMTCFKSLFTRYEMTVLFVTHNIEEAKFLGNKGVFLVDGKINELVLIHQLSPFSIEVKEKASLTS